MQPPQNNPPTNDVEEIDVTEILQRIEALEKSHLEIKAEIETLRNELTDTGDTLDYIAQKLGS